MKKVLIDTDPGVDDAFALFYAFGADRFDILGLTTVFGNVTVETATRNALWLCEAAGRPDIPVSQGAAGPLDGRAHEPAVEVHGPHGFGDMPACRPTTCAAQDCAADRIIRVARDFPGEVEIIALGPLTNLAMAVTRAPDIAGLLRHVHVMGGAFWAPGNVTRFAEANILNDPEAAAIVARSFPNLTFVGLDVTDRIFLTRDDVGKLAELGGPLSGFIRKSAEYYLGFYASRGKLEGAGLHDPTVMIATLHPEWFDRRIGSVSVALDGTERGQTRLAAGAGPVAAVVSADGPAIRHQFLETVGTFLHRSRQRS